MIKIYVKKQSNYPISAAKIKRRLTSVFKEHGVVSDSVVYVTVVGKEKMLALARKYLNEKNTLHNVLSFPESEVRGKFIYPPGPSLVQLGEIVLCFPKIVEEANIENKLIDDKAVELAEHSALHLLGIHHD